MAKKVTASSLIRSYLSRRRSPANMSQIVDAVTKKDVHSRYTEETIRRTVYHMVSEGVVENQAQVRRPNGSRFVLSSM